MSRAWRTYALLAALFGLFVLVALLGHFAGRFDPVRDHSSLRTNPWGTKAYRELLQRCGLRAETWDRPLTELEDAVELLVLFAPQLPMSDDEQRHLLRWVGRGGTLVLAPFGEAMDVSAPTCAGGACAPAGPSMRQLLARLELSLGPAGKPNELAKVATPSALTADVGAVSLPSRYRLEWLNMEDEASRARLREQGVSEDWIAVMPASKRAQTRTDLTADGRPVLVTIRWGRGRVHVLAEVEILANGQIAKADNVVLAANLAFADAVPGCVHFSEYHHFVGRAFAGGHEGVDIRPVRWALWAILAVAAIYALGRAQRFGAPVVRPEQPRRSSAEYVRAFAEIYWRARASGAALGMLAAGFRRRLSQAAGVPPSADPQRLAEGLRRRGLPGDEMVDLLAAVETQAAEQTSEAELVRLARTMARYERML